MRTARLIPAAALMLAASGASFASGTFGKAGGSAALSLARLPLTFEKNTGRYDKQVKFLTRTGGATVFITGNEAVMVLRGQARGERREASGAATNVPSPRLRGEPDAPIPSPRLRGEGQGEGQGARAATDIPSPRWRGEGQGEGRRSLSALSPQPSAQRHVLRMKLLGAKPGIATGLEKQQGIVNYFIGNDPKQWRTNIPTYARAKLAGVYPGIDVVYYGQEPRAKRQELRATSRRSRSALSSQLSTLSS